MTRLPELIAATGKTPHLQHVQVYQDDSRGSVASGQPVANALLDVAPVVAEPHVRHDRNGKLGDVLHLFLHQRLHLLRLFR